MVALLDFILPTLEKKKMLHSKGPFVGNVFKHPARCVINILKLIVIILQKRFQCFFVLLLEGEGIM